ncbi:MAG: RNA 2',3'-cyclic phosphodiesterase [Caulobacteraceae bacterium]|nr:RNA 2',3'-cyclic phosphodiesterase [Caulobacteraceae bacterium]
MIRLFTAVEIPAPIAESLSRRQQGLPGARWRPREALHITLAFYGEIHEAVAAELDAALAELRAPALQVELAGAGAFGEGADIRAVWAGVERNEALNDLAARCQAVGRKLGVPVEKRAYRPHVTLAYLRRPDPDRVAAWIAGHNLLHSPPFAVDWFGLWSSWLSKDGSRYELERDYSLRP